MIFLKKIFKKILINISILKPEKCGRHGLVGDIELFDMKREFQISFLKANGLRPEHKLLDLGCGTLRGGIPIIMYLNPGHYCGIDIRPKVLDEAKKELEENSLEYKFPLLLNKSEANTLLWGKGFDFIWAFSVLIHMKDSIFKDTLKFVTSHLADNGIFYGNVNIGRKKNREWQGFPCVTRPLTFYEREATKCGLRLRVLGSLESLGHISGRENQDQQIMLEFKHIKRPH